MLWDVDYTLVDSDGVGRMLYTAAFWELFGREMPHPGLMSGRTDRAIALEVLTLAGLAEPQQHIAAFQAVQAARAAELAGAVREHSRVLPGAAAAIAALAGLAEPEVVQSLLTGNIRPLAEVKLGPLGLLDHLDLDASAPTATSTRSGPTWCPGPARGPRLRPRFRRPGHRHGRGHPAGCRGRAASGARAVGVATGGFPADELAAAGAMPCCPA